MSFLLNKYANIRISPSDLASSANVPLDDKVLQALELPQIKNLLDFYDSHVEFSSTRNPTGINKEVRNFMLANGTVINGKMIETPKSLLTAATVASQISLDVASGQYGGQTMSIAHLAPYVRVSHDKWMKKYQEEVGDKLSEEEINKLVDKFCFFCLVAIICAVFF